MSAYSLISSIHCWDCASSFSSVFSTLSFWKSSFLISVCSFCVFSSILSKTDSVILSLIRSSYSFAISRSNVSRRSFCFDTSFSRLSLCPCVSSSHNSFTRFSSSVPSPVTAFAHSWILVRTASYRSSASTRCWVQCAFPLWI